MARVVVVGGGFGGLASAARLAKLGHDVTLVEAGHGSAAPSGSSSRTASGGTPGRPAPRCRRCCATCSASPAAPLEREVELVPLEPLREHRLRRRLRALVLAFRGSRGAQLAAVDEASAPAGGAVGRLRGRSSPTTWDRLRRDWFERPYAGRAREQGDRGAALDAADAAQGRCRSVQGRPAAPRGVPDARWTATTRATCRRGWACGLRRAELRRPGPSPAASASLADVLTTRLASGGSRCCRRRRPSTSSCPAAGRRRAHRPRGVEADHVVCAVDPRRLPALAPTSPGRCRRSRRSSPTSASSATVPDLPREVVLHGDPPLVRAHRRHRAAGRAAWTLLGRGRLAEDILVALARAGDRRPRPRGDPRRPVAPDLVQACGGSPYGVLWQGRDTVDPPAGPRTPYRNGVMAGAHATPGAGLPFVGLSAALVAEVIGPA